MKEVYYERSNNPGELKIERLGDKFKIYLGVGVNLRENIHQERLARALSSYLTKPVDYREQSFRRMVNDHIRGMEFGKTRFTLRDF